MQRMQEPLRLGAVGGQPTGRGAECGPDQDVEPTEINLIPTPGLSSEEGFPLERDSVTILASSLT